MFFTRKRKRVPRATRQIAKRDQTYFFNANTDQTKQIPNSVATPEGLANLLSTKRLNLQFPQVRCTRKTQHKELEFVFVKLRLIILGVPT